MSNTRAIFLTARRELRERLRSRAFQVSMAIQLLLVAGIIALSVLTSSGAETVRVAVAGPEARATAEAARARQEAFDLEIKIKGVRDARAARSELQEDRADLALAGGQLLTGAEPPQDQVTALQSAAREVRLREQLRAEGLSDGQARRALATQPLEVDEIPGTDESGQGLAFAGSLLLYIAIFTAGLQVAAGIVEEKSSRVVEIVLSAVRPRDLLAGKVLGLGLAGILQLAVIVGLGLGAALASGEVDLPESTASTAALVVVYFVLGYAFYACAFAAAGAIVSRQEDTQTTTAPMTVMLVGAYLVSIAALDDPGGTLARVCSFIPPVAPLVVPARAAQDALPGVELVGSLAAMVLGTVLLVLLAARIYERSVLMLGAPLKLGAALRLLR